MTTDFYSKTGHAMFSAGSAALSDWNADTRRMLTVSAPAGADKTAFSYALMMAVTRNAEKNPAAPHGCVYVVDQISKADDAYRELNALLPGKVAVWTTEHDVNCKEFPKLKKRPAAQFDREALRLYPVVIVTHQFYLGSKGHKARNVVRNGLFLPRPRALTIVDERPKEVETFAVLLSEAQSVREALQETHPEAKEHLDNLLRFMEQLSYAPANGLFRPASRYRRILLMASLGSTRASRAPCSVCITQGTRHGSAICVCKSLDVGGGFRRNRWQRARKVRDTQANSLST